MLIFFTGLIEIYLAEVLARFAQACCATDLLPRSNGWKLISSQASSHWNTLFYRTDN